MILLFKIQSSFDKIQDTFPLITVQIHRYSSRAFFISNTCHVSFSNQTTQSFPPSFLAQSDQTLKRSHRRHPVQPAQTQLKENYAFSCTSQPNDNLRWGAQSQHHHPSRHSSERKSNGPEKTEWLRKMRHDSDTLLILASPRGASSLGQHVALERPEVVNLTALTWRRLGSFYRFFTAPVRAPPGIDIGSYSGKGGFIGIVLG